MTAEHMFYKQAFSPETYDKSIEAVLPYYEEYFKQIIDIATEVFHRPITWLDIGCGTGKMADTAVKNLQIKKMICCDSSQGMLKAAKERICSSNVDFLEASMESLEFDCEFDIVTAILVNHYLKYEDRMAGIRNCYNALKKGGLLFTVENFAPNNDRMKALYLERWKHYQYRNGRSREECGFENAEIFWCSYVTVQTQPITPLIGWEPTQ